MTTCAVAVYVEWRFLEFFFGVTAAFGIGIAAILQIRERISGSLAGAEIKDDLRRPAITGRRVRDAGGLLLVLASAAALVAGIPTVWCFFAIAIGAGLVVAIVMHRAHG